MLTQERGRKTMALCNWQNQKETALPSPNQLVGQIRSIKRDAFILSQGGHPSSYHESGLTRRVPAFWHWWSTVLDGGSLDIVSRFSPILYSGRRGILNFP